MLGVAPDADVGEIRQAYLAAARAHHPDYHATEDEAGRTEHATLMKAVTEAWSVLGDAARRADYDERRHLSALGAPATERDRSHRRPEAPAGKGWTPRPGDDGWMDDFGTWAEERDRLLPDEEVAGPGRRSPGGVVAVGFFLLSVLVGFLGIVLEARSMLAAAAAGVVLSSVLFIVLPLVEMTRRHPKQGAPSETNARTPFRGDPT